MKERRKARVGTVSGLALLVGGTAIAAVAHRGHSAFTTVALGILTLALGHALLDEVRRQAGRGAARGWAGQDTANVLLLGCWSAGSLALTVLTDLPPVVRVVTGTLTAGYAIICGCFAWLRRRTVRHAATERATTVLPDLVPSSPETTPAP